MYCCMTLKQYNVCVSNDLFRIQTRYNGRKHLCNGINTKDINFSVN